MTDDIRTATVRALWDDTSTIYHDVMAPALTEPHLALKGMVGDVAGRDVLDLGCGMSASRQIAWMPPARPRWLKSPGWGCHCVTPGGL